MEDGNIRLLSGIALIGWLPMPLAYIIDNFISPIPGFSCDTAECIIPTGWYYLLIIAFFSVLYSIAAYCRLLYSGIKGRHWALVVALPLYAVISILGGFNLSMNPPLAVAWASVLRTNLNDPAVFPPLNALMLIMFTSVPVLLFALPQRFLRPLRLLPALICLAVAGGALTIFNRALWTNNAILPSEMFTTLAAVYVLVWAAATALILWAFWAASHGQPAATDTAPAGSPAPGAGADAASPSAP
ncbi:MAG TPA: hypothetical protein VFY89_01465 [Ktedonobacterales bacterium]